MRFPDELPAEREQRWQLLSELLASWWPSGWGRLTHGISPQRLDEAERRLGKPLPVALREWYCGYGALGEFWSRHDKWLAPEELEFVDGVLIFYVENQSVVQWGIRIGDLVLDDPKVVIDGPDGDSTWRRESPSLSEFALQMFLHCLQWSDKNRGWTSGPARRGVVRVLKTRYRRLPLRSWSWPAPPTYFLGDEDTLVELNGTSDMGWWIYACARSESAFQKVQEVLARAGFQPEASSDEWPPGWTTAAEDPIA